MEGTSKRQNETSHHIIAYNMYPCVFVLYLPKLDFCDVLMKRFYVSLYYLALANQEIPDCITHSHEFQAAALKTSY